LAIISKIAFGIALNGVLILLAVKWMIPAVSLWIVISPMLVLAGLVFFIWAVEAFYEGFKILLRLGFIITIIYLFWRLFL
jgi:hypothetical protein